MSITRTRGKRAGITRPAILTAAVKLADREGLSALSMRRLGAELGVEAMTLYHHIPNKEAILDGMVEHVAAQATPPTFDPASWQEAMRHFAHSLLAALSAHPNMVPLFVSRPATTAQNLRTMEAALEALHSAGFELTRALDAVGSLVGFVLGHVATRPAGDPTDAAPGWRRPAASPEVDADAYPLLAEALRRDEERDPMARFEFALEALLTGFAMGEDG